MRNLRSIISGLTLVVSMLVVVPAFAEGFTSSGFGLRQELTGIVLPPGTRITHEVFGHRASAQRTAGLLALEVQGNPTLARDVVAAFRANGAPPATLSATGAAHFRRLQDTRAAVRAAGGAPVRAPRR